MHALFIGVFLDEHVLIVLYLEGIDVPENRVEKDESDGTGLQIPHLNLMPNANTASAKDLVTLDELAPLVADLNCGLWSERFRETALNTFCGFRFATSPRRK